MAKLVLKDITTGYNFSRINENFEDIEEEFQNNVLYRDNPIGEDNSMKNDLDMDGNDILNVGNIDVTGITIDGESDPFQTAQDNADASEVSKLAAQAAQLLSEEARDASIVAKEASEAALADATTQASIAGGYASAASTSASEAAQSALDADVSKIEWKGAWSAGEYLLHDAVSYNGSSYLANKITSEEPSLTANDWDLIAKRGDNGTGVGSVTSITAGTGLTGGEITESGTIAVDFGTTTGKVASGDHTHTGVYQPVDDDLTALAAISGARGDIIYYGASGWTRLAKGAGGKFLKIGANDPAWDNALMPGTSSNITVGYTTDEYAHGTISTGTVTLSLTEECIQTLTNNGAFTLAPPSSGNGCINLMITNDASAGTITTSGFTKVIGTYATTNAKKYLFQVLKTSVASVLYIVEVV